jgi:transposase InsO family protein
MDRKFLLEEQQVLLLPIVLELREEHPGVAARELYNILKPESMGRDRFEAYCFKHGLKLERKKNFTRTTDSGGVIRFPNLVIGRELTDTNQVWVSDITYYQIADKVYYLTFIMDLYSRVIVGYNVSHRLKTEQTTLPALKLALRVRKPRPGLIFHSDGGGQYYCKEFLELTAKWKIKNSMCDIVFENSHAERINGTIKNQYIKGYNPQSYETLIKMTHRAVFNYNGVRPHQSLGGKTPLQFEKPAGGYSLPSDIFCTFNNQPRQHQKKYHLSTS